MTNYTTASGPDIIDRTKTVWYVTFADGPNVGTRASLTGYKNEESAKRRIRGLKQKEIPVPTATLATVAETVTRSLDTIAHELPKLAPAPIADDSDCMPEQMEAERIERENQAIVDRDEREAEAETNSDMLIPAIETTALTVAPLEKIVADYDYAQDDPYYGVMPATCEIAKLAEIAATTITPALPDAAKLAASSAYGKSASLAGFVNSATGQVFSHPGFGRIEQPRGVYPAISKRERRKRWQYA